MNPAKWSWWEWVLAITFIATGIFNAPAAARFLVGLGKSGTGVYFDQIEIIEQEVAAPSLRRAE